MFTVLNLNNSGTGSLRQAILNANTHAGADAIDFNVAGTIRLTTGALPTITGNVDIDGTTAPGFATTPVVEVDFNHFGGLVFNPGSAGSTLRSLGLVNAAVNGVTVNGGGGMLIAGNFIGLHLDGTTPAANGGNGLDLIGSSGNTVGGTAAQDRNVISANLFNGIRVGGSSRNQILGNYIGTDATGTLDRGNGRNGILVTAGATSNTIGGSPGNVISGNDGNGMLLNGQSALTTVSGNLIGLAASGTAALGNRLDGVSVVNSNSNLIGHSDPVTGVTYYNADSVGMQPVSGWQGIRNADTSGQYLITGTSDANGLLFEGTMAGVGTSYSVNYPSAATTSVYGPDNLGGGDLRLVGSYKNSDYATAAVTVNGFLFQGTTADLSNSSNYRTIDYPGAKYNYVHSTMGGLVVGNYDSPAAHGSYSLPFGPGHAFLYDVAQSTFLTDIVYPGSKSNTAYGIWYNGGTSYTICGGYSLDPVNNFGDQSQPIGRAYLVDYDSATGKFSHWTSFDYPNGVNFVTHFQGISSVEKGVYTLSADSVQAGSSNPAQGSWVTVRRNADGSFGPAVWVNLNYTGVDPTTNITSSNAVYGNQVVGIVIGSDTFSYQATVNVGFQLSNVISANGGNGISLYTANGNQVAMNYVGTDATGTLALGNAGNGILVTAGAAGNVIGGQATGGNDPTNGVFVRPPQGNLISGNNANGVLITGLATQNRLNGNFIGTAASGNSALGNALDGVAIVNANGNQLIGCTFQQNPFVFYNVISGNGGNGLRVTNSNGTTIQANFFGMGADNNTAVGNNLNGAVVEGTSANTVMGGPIPLGNVDAANWQNGLVVRDTASGFVTYNTFCGLAAFSNNPNFGNGRDGMLITSTGGNILIRTNVITRNGNNGIEISGNATGVRVSGNIIGLNTQGNVAMGNVGNGVEVGGTAHGIIIGGPQPTFNIIPHNAISANGGNGLAVVGSAHDVRVNFSYIGTDLLGDNQYGNIFGNARAGVLLGPGTYSTSVGSTDPSLLTVISGNLGNGIEMRGTHGNTVVGCLIGTDAAGLIPLPNAGNGVLINNSSNNVIGRTSAGSNGTAGGPANLIAFNGANGVEIDSGNGNGVRENSIYGNTLLGIDLGPWANMSAAAPVLTSVQMMPLGVQVSGTVTGAPNTLLTIEFFASDTSGPSGRYYLGSQTVQTNAAGFAAFSFYGPLPPTSAHFISATATDPSNNTSEFSAPPT
jgi:parallel beta-helix repeat protein